MRDELEVREEECKTCSRIIILNQYTHKWESDDFDWPSMCYEPINWDGKIIEKPHIPKTDPPAPPPPPKVQPNSNRPGARIPFGGWGFRPAVVPPTREAE